MFLALENTNAILKESEVEPPTFRFTLPPQAFIGNSIFKDSAYFCCCTLRSVRIEILEFPMGCAY